MANEQLTVDPQQRFQEFFKTGKVSSKNRAVSHHWKKLDYNRF